MKIIEILRLTYNRHKFILNLTKQINSTKLSRMTHLGFKEPRIRGIRGGVGVKCENLAKYQVLREG